MLKTQKGLEGFRGSLLKPSSVPGPQGAELLITPTLVEAFSLIPSGSWGSKALLIKIVLMIKALIIPVSFSTGRNVFQIRQFRV